MNRLGCVLRCVSGAMVLLSTATVSADTNPDARMLRYPDVSKDSIVFSYANDLWIVSRDGGTARPLASPAGVEYFPRFSPDGKTIAFMGNYEGNSDIYTIPEAGGIAQRMTHHATRERLCDWTPDGKHFIFYARGLAKYPRADELFTVPADGGIPEKMPVPYGALGAVSGDGQWLAYVPHTRDHRTWKRYKGGMATDIWLFNLRTNESRKITDWDGSDSQPMWHDGKVYYLSDAGPAHRYNIWVYDPDNDTRRQITRYEDYDIKWPAMGPGPRGRGEIVFQNGSNLYLLDLRSERSRSVRVTIPGDRPKLRTQTYDVANDIGGWDVSPSAKRAVVEARGDIWTLPKDNGLARNLTRTDGVYERYPTWSPDGRWIAYVSDESGEYHLYVTQSDGKGDTKQLTDDMETFWYSPQWSPNSKLIAITNKAGEMYLYNFDDESFKLVDKNQYGGMPGASWSQDSNWIAYYKGQENWHNAIWLYNVSTGENHQVTSGMYSDTAPAFDREGDYLYYASSREFSGPTYEDRGLMFVYTNTERMIAVPLRDDIESPFLKEIDEETWDDDAKDEDEGDDKNGDDENGENGDESDESGDSATGIAGTWDGTATGADLPPEGISFTLTFSVTDGVLSGSISVADMPVIPIADGTYTASTGEFSFSIVWPGPEGMVNFTISGKVSGDDLTATGDGGGGTVEISATRVSSGGGDDSEDGNDDKKKKKGKGKKEVEPVEIDLAGFEARGMVLPVGRGSFGAISVNNKNQVIYAHFRRGDGGGGIKLFDMFDDDPKVKDVISGGSYRMTPDGKQLLVRRGGGLSVIKAAPNQKANDRMQTDGMRMHVNPRNEWAQMLREVYRQQRDFFYDPTLHGVDWEAKYESYAALLDDCASREDLSFLIRELISELNVGHAYYRAGDSESGPRVNVGLLGCDFSLENGAFRIAKIYRGADWDQDMRSPLSAPGIDVNEGDYLLAVNGLPLDTSKDPWAAFQGLAGDLVTLTVSEKPTMDDEARDVHLETMRSDSSLRYYAWMENNRQYVDEASDGQIGYIYVQDTGQGGQNNLFRQFYSQTDKAALIIDERWNGGGQIPDRFIELLNRPRYNYFALRDSKDWPTPRISHQGPKAMLINGLAGSGGDMFPALFRQAGLGKLIGTRTWGGLVGISGTPGLIDGSAITVPRFAYYELDGTWGIEGYGVDPDIEVVDDPAKFVGGKDPQIDAAIEHLLKELKTKRYVSPPRPAYPDRSGMGIAEEDR